MMDLNEKVALITGAATGIGLAYVKELLRNGLKEVAVTDINSIEGQKVVDELKQEFGESRVIFVPLDVTNKIQFEEAFETTVKTFKQLDIVINNAGINHEIDWEKCISVNLNGTVTGTYLAVEKYLPKYRSTSDAVVINTSSIAGLDVVESVPIYSTTKLAVIGFTRAMGAKFRYETTKIRVIGVCPGLTDTKIIKLTTQQVAEPYRSQFLDIVASQYSQQPDVLAKHVADLIRNGASGSTWHAADDKCTSVDFPRYVKYHPLLQ